jgi:hypothetical protein
MATWTGKPWNTLRGLVTTAGVWMSVYHPGAEGEWVEVLGPSGASQRVDTPGLLDWQLVAYDGKVSVFYNRDEGDGRKGLVAVHTPIVCGGMVGELVAGATGPIGPAGAQGPQGEQGEQGEQGPAGPAGEDAVALTADDIDRIAERVWLMPPPEHLKDLAGVDLGALSQIVIAYLMTQRQDVKQLEIQRFDEAALGLVSGGYTPKVGV